MSASSRIWTIDYLRDRYGVDLSSDSLHHAAASAECAESTGFDSQINAPVIIQWVSKESVTADDYYRLDSTYEILSQIRSPSFIRPTDWGEAGEVIFLVRPQENLPTLAHWATERKSTNYAGVLSVRQSLRIVQGILDSLTSIHQANCVYRHLRPDRLLMGEFQGFLLCPQLQDFASRIDQRVDQLLISAQFASPELSGSIDHDVGPVSDLYSVGVLLYTLLAGRPPYDGDSVGNILLQHMTHNAPLESMQQNVPPVVLDILDRLLKKEPRDRYQSAYSAAMDVAQVLEVLEKGEQIEHFAIGRHDIRHWIVEPAFVGRKSEMEQLQLAIESTVKGQGLRIAISSPSGIGKSRLVMEALRSASRNGVTIFRSGASNLTTQLPGAVVRSIVEQLADRVKSDPQLRQRIAQRLAPHRTELSIEFPELSAILFGRVTDDTNHTEMTLSRTRSDLLFGQLLAQLGDATNPALIWIDDCQWLDLRTLGVLEKLDSFDARYCLFLFTLRSEEASDRFWERIKLDQRLELTHLSDDEVRALVQSMAGRLPEAAVLTIIRLAEGSPFMASAILRGMVESGALYATAQGWQIESEKLASIQASSNAAEALLSRLENVPSNVLQQLSVAAIIGKEFDDKAVVALTGTGLKESRTCFEWSRQQRLIWSMPGGNYAFIHDKIREMLLERLPKEQRRELHLQYAQYLQASDTSDYTFELAYHYDAADAHSKALPFAISAAETARRLHSLDRAEELLRIAIRGLPQANSAVRYQVQTGLADVLMLAGKYDDAARFFEQAQASVSSPLESAVVALKSGELSFKRGDKEQAVHQFRDALETLGEKIPSSRWRLFAGLLVEIIIQFVYCCGLARTPRKLVPLPELQKTICRLYSRIAHGWWYTQSKYHVLWAHLRGMNRAERYAPSAELAQAYSEHAPAMSLIPWHSRGIDYATRSLKIRQSLGDAWGQGQSRNFHSILLYSASDFEACIEQASQAERILMRLGDPWEVNIARYQLAASLYRLGDLRGALDVARRTYESSLAIGDFQSTGNIIDVWVRAGLCRIPDEILSAETARTLRDRQGQCQVLLAEGISLFGKRSYGQAADKFQLAIDIAQQAGVCNTFITPNYPWLATALRCDLQANPPLTEQQRRQKVRHLVRVAKRATRIGKWFQNELPHALREYGAAMAMAGKPRKARRLLRESFKIARWQQAEYEHALTGQIYATLGRELQWSDASITEQHARKKMREIRQSITVASAGETLSLQDRFDTLLSAGRQIISATTREEVFDKMIEAARMFLRGQRTILLAAYRDGEHLMWQSVSGGNDEYDLALVEQAIAAMRTVTTEQETVVVNDQKQLRHGTFLCSPILAHGKIVAVVYVANEYLSGLYGRSEIRIADYLATTCGGALEKAASIEQLTELNISLEQKVLDRTEAVAARSRQLEQTAQELLATQAKLEQARDDAQSANNAKSEFLARISHEIRTPISAINGFTELLLRGAIDAQQQQRTLDIILANGSHLLQLINDLLDLSKIEAEKMQIETIECCPVEITRDVIDSLQMRAQKKSLALSVEIADSVPHMIYSDPTRLRQILINIVGNAIKFTPVGSVTVRVTPPETLTVSANEHDQSSSKGATPAPTILRFIVSDTGIGMTATQMEKIFDPFTQSDASVTRRFGGTGLGLTISKQLAEALGGGIEVTSSFGQGSTFTITIATGLTGQLGQKSHPTCEHPRANSLARQFVQADLAGKRILVVDDASTNRDLLSVLLRNANALVELAEDGQQALDFWARDQQVDAILLDMQMPVLDGYSAAGQLRANGCDKPIIALTANSMQGDEQRCLDAGCSDYLPKPLNINLLLQKLVDVLGGRLVETSARETLIHEAVPYTVNDSFEAINSELGGSADRVDCLDPIYQNELPAEEPFRTFALEFLGHLKNCRNELISVARRQDYAELARRGHWIKGTGGTVGLASMKTLGTQLEEASHSACQDRVNQVLDKLWHYADILE